jgi:hypothetical protein
MRSGRPGLFVSAIAELTETSPGPASLKVLSTDDGNKQGQKNLYPETSRPEPVGAGTRRTRKTVTSLIYLPLACSTGLNMEEKSGARAGRQREKTCGRGGGL